MKIPESIIKELMKSKAKTPDDLARAKRRLAKKHKTPLFSNIALLKRYHELVKNRIIKNNSLLGSLLRTRPIRSLSGVVNISVLTKPYPCPGKCLYCPAERGIPKSYVSGEPAVERAKALKFNPYLQVKRRIEMLENEGHPTDKIELRIVGGTWRKCFNACNAKISKNLATTQAVNEKSKNRIVGLSVETRPDFINGREIKHLRELGATMVELGVQSIYDDVLKLNLRGHLVKDTVFATKLLKNAGFKVLYQMMPNLPGSNSKRDEEMFEELFENPDFRPDMLKIYPCALLKEAPLYKLYKSGEYKPYREKELIKLIRNIKKKIPRYARIQRITRDIPSKSIIAGAAKISNLRQMLSENMKKENWECGCIRCREVKGEYDAKEKIFLFRKDYEASGGKEIFLSFENKDRTKLYSLLRLRITSQNKSIVREIHTFGQLHALRICGGPTSSNSPQHKGLGKRLIKEAERITYAEFKKNAKKELTNSHGRIRISRGRKPSDRFWHAKIAVIAGAGARDYFRKLGYKLRNTYMIKKIKAGADNARRNKILPF
jgi:elongator complex protein 3